MSTSTFTAPAAGTRVVQAIEPGQTLRFTFPLEGATIARDGSSLSIVFDGGGELFLENFFVVGDAGSLPALELADGAVVASADILAGLNPDLDLSTAAGPTAAPAASSGVGEYSDAAGSVLDGVDRLGSLGTDQWEGGISTVAADPDSALLAGVGEEGVSPSSPGAPDIPGAPDTPGVPDIPEEPKPIVPTGIAYQARAVLYTKDGGDGSEIHVGIVDKNGVRINVTPDDVTREILLPEGLDTAYFEVTGVTPDGQIVLQLTDAGRAALASGEDLFNYLRIGVGGHEYTVQLTVSPDNSFDSKIADANRNSGGYPEDGRLLYGEHHEGSRVSAQGGTENLIDASASGGDMVFHDGGMIATGDGSVSRVNLHTAAGSATSVSLASSTHQAVMDAASGGKNTIDGSSAAGAVDVSLVQNNTLGKGVMYASGAGSENTIRDVNSVSFETKATGGDSSVLWAEDGGKNTVAAVDGEIFMANTGANATLYASGADSANTIRNTGSVTLDGKDLSSGSSTMWAKDGGRNTIEDVEGDVTVHGSWNAMTADGNPGVSSTDAGNTISDVTGKVEINADFRGMYAANQGNNNVISGVGNGVSVIVENKDQAHYNSGNAIAMKAQGGGNTIKDVTGDVTLRASGRDVNYKAYVLEAASGENRIDDIRGNVELTGGHAVMWAHTSTNQPTGKNIISNVTGKVELTSAFWQGAENTVMRAANGTNSIENVGGVEMKARIYGMEADRENSLNKVSGVKGDVSITTSDIGEGMHADRDDESGPLGGKNIVEHVEGNLTITAGTGMYARYNSENTVSNVKGNVTLEAQGVYGDGMSGSGTNIISDVGGDVRVTGGGTAMRGSSTPIYDGQGNTIQNVGGNVWISGANGMDGQNYISNVGSHDESGNVVGGNVTVESTGGTHTAALQENGSGARIGWLEDDISANTEASILGNVVLKSQNGVAMHGGYADTAGVRIAGIGGDVTLEGGQTGMRSWNSGNARITHVEGDVHVEGGTHGMYAYVQNAGYGKGGTNIISDVGGTISIQGGQYGMYAGDLLDASGNPVSNQRQAPSANTIQAGDASGIEVRISVEPGQGEKAYALFASSYGTNTIKGSASANASDFISIKGDVFAHGLGKNIIETGNGRTIVELDGAILSKNALTIETHGDRDVLVLRAANAGEFTTRYQTWLKQLASDPSIDITEIKVLVADAPGASLAELGLGWMTGQDFFPGKVESMTEEAYQAYQEAFFSSDSADESASFDGASAARASTADLVQNDSGSEADSGHTAAVLAVEQASFAVQTAASSQAEGDVPNAVEHSADAVFLDVEILGRLQEMEFPQSEPTSGMESADTLGLSEAQGESSLHLILSNDEADTIDAAFLNDIFSNADDVTELHLVVDQNDIVNLEADSGWRLVQETSGVDAGGGEVNMTMYQLVDESEMLTLFIQQTSVTG